MPINSNIALQVQQQPAPDALNSLAKVLGIKNAIAQQPLIESQVQRAGLENQQLTQQIGATQALNDAYKTTVTVGPDGTPTLDKDAITQHLASQGYGAQIPGVMQHFSEMEKAAGEVKKQKADLAESEQNYVGSLGAAAKAASYDPTVLATGLQHGVALGYQSAGQALQLLQSDPSKAQAIADRLIAGSPKQTQLQNETTTAAASTSRANTEATKETREAGVQQRAQALQQASAVTDPASYAAWIERNPVLKSEAPAQYDPAFVARITREAVPAKDQPEYDIQTKTAQAMATMKPEDWQAQVDHIAPPKGETAALNARTRTLVNSAVLRGDYKAAQAAIKDASDQLGREDVAKKNNENKISIDMGSFSGANGEPSPTAQAVAHYQIPSAQAMSRMSPPARDALMRQVLQINPQFQEQNYNTFNATEKDAVTGKIGTSANALNTMMGHLSVLDQAAAALKNGDVQAINKIANFIGAQTGRTAQTTYDTIVHRLGPEVTKAYISSGGSVGERGTNEADFSRNLGPDQIRANIGVSAQLADSKIKALQDQYNRGTYGQGKQKLISDEAEQARQRLAGQSPLQGGGAATPPAGAKVQRNSATGQIRWSTDGGKTWQTQ